MNSYKNEYAKWREEVLQKAKDSLKPNLLKGFWDDSLKNDSFEALSDQAMYFLKDGIYPDLFDEKTLNDGELAFQKKQVEYLEKLEPYKKKLNFLNDEFVYDLDMKTEILNFLGCQQ